MKHLLAAEETDDLEVWRATLKEIRTFVEPYSGVRVDEDQCCFQHLASYIRLRGLRWQPSLLRPTNTLLSRCRYIVKGQ